MDTPLLGLNFYLFTTKFVVKIRYKKNRCRFFLLISNKYSQQYYGQLTTFRLQIACCVHVQTTRLLPQHVIFALKRWFTGILYYCTFDWGPDKPGNIYMLIYLNSCSDPIPSPPVPSYLLLPVYLYAQCLHVPVSPAKFISPQPWTLDTHNFFWLSNFAPYFGKVLKYRYILTSRSLLFFCAVENNQIFYEQPLVLWLDYRI